jgi:hypothetical protein
MFEGGKPASMVTAEQFQQAPFCVFRTGRQDCGAPEGLVRPYGQFSLLRSLTFRRLLSLWRTLVRGQFAPKTVSPEGKADPFPQPPFMPGSEIVEIPSPKLAIEGR